MTYHVIFYNADNCKVEGIYTKYNDYRNIINYCNTNNLDIILDERY